MPERFPYSPTTDNDFGRALAAGKITATVTGSTGHITVRATCKHKAPNGRWTTTRFENATHVFLDVPSASGEYADKIGTFYPLDRPGQRQQGVIWRDSAQTDDRRWKAGLYVLKAACGLVDGRYADPAGHCLRCGREITHPDSIGLAFGPECAKEVGLAGNRSGTDAGAHETKSRDRLPVREFERTGETDVPVAEEDMPPKVEPATTTVLDFCAEHGDVQPCRACASLREANDEALRDDDVQTPVRETYTLTANDDPRAILAGLEGR